MLFACNAKNTNISFGVFDGERLVFDSRIATSCDKSADEYAILLQSIFAMYQVDLPAIDGAVIASVVRPLTVTLCQAVERLMRVKPMLVGPGVKTGLNIKTDIPSQVGADIVANAVAATALADSPMVLLDLGMATTLAGINAAGDLCGVLICPGVRSSLDALSDQASDLPAIALETPRHLLGKNTIESMAGGIIYGHAAMIDGLLDRIAEEWNTDSLTVLATGGYAEQIIPYCRRRTEIRYEPHLALLGLKRIHFLNSRSKS